MKKEDKLTFVEFAHHSERLFSDWINSSEVKDYDGLKELILLENFKDNVPAEIKLYIEEKQTTELQTAARLADEYNLTHPVNSKKHEPARDRKPNRPDSFVNYCHICRQNGHHSKECRRADKGPFSSYHQREPTCFSCNQRGHVSRDCPKRKDVRIPVNIVSRKSVNGEADRWKETVRHFGDYLSKGQIYANPNGKFRKSVTSLRDTASACSLILRSALPEGAEISFKDKVILEGIPGADVICPSTKIRIEDKLVQTTGAVKLLIVDALPVFGVDLVVGNDIGRKPPVATIVMSESERNDVRVVSGGRGDGESDSVSEIEERERER